MAKITGKVKWWNDNKGYGFIKSDTLDQDIFAHYSEISTEGFKTLTADEIVTFDLGNGTRGPEAKNIIRSIKE